ncbi:Uncharacterized conserved protein YecE, DUF72 family [Fodinibius salinus]|uniref:Uncharacterized conserved protein YecE, DUF72 family n=1 Tax=Fodinibius salinus TaxID=860790 RepID=A0A5D3YNY4_9BACT|nr:DUF72 domain-containing protein [Fodinibius salinus]TYP93869.1 Uncharacterized conserved protein YecE, DUF72 family [Fodinibius salinus]
MPIRKYHIGCTGWSLKEWVGNFFTDDAKQREFLKQYASVFNSVEGNTTFYNIPAQRTVQKWGKATPDEFKFCFKFHRSITHEKQLKNVESDILEFLEVFDPIADRLGPFMIQLPPQFSPESFSRLETMVGVLPSSYSYAVEVRHPDFYNQGREEHRLNRLLRSYNIDRVVFDTRKLHAMKPTDPSVQKAQKKKPNSPVRFNNTGSRPMVRFVGGNDPVANESYLKEWAIVVADWIKEGLHPYFFPHSPDRVSQPKIARTFHRMLTELVDLEPMPAWPIDRQDKQIDLF